ncbi:MAG: T9SS type A sorting domain-containing protein [Flavobacteriales bacterium]|nr:T9SS type A sorting domain-containing protein [Flavobacteriales bacterium]
MKKIFSLFTISYLISFSSISQVVLNENFSSGSLPLGWTESSVSAGDIWEYGNTVDFGPSSVLPDASGNLGEYASMDFSDDPDTTSLITPAVSILGITNPRLTFQYITQSTATNFNPWNRLIVDYWNGTAWTNITVIDTLTPAGWTFYDFNISTYTYNTDSVQFRFSAHEGGAAIGGTGTGTFNQDMALDEVVIENTPSCFKPTSLFTNTVPTGVELNWTENNAATVWEVEYDTLGSTLGTGTRNVITANPTILTSLMAGTSYDWYVRSACAVGDSSAWVKGTSFLYAGAPLAGTYTINSASATAGTNFGNFADLAYRLNFAGISAPVTVNVAAGTYNEQFSLGNINGTSSMNTIVIDGGSASTTTISHDRTIRNSTVTFDGARYITFKNMTVIATSSTSDTWGINILGGSRYITIDSSTITMQTGSLSDVAGINICNETSDQSSGSYGYNITISNNSVTGGERGITAYGNNTSSLRNTNIDIINNTTQNTDDYGIFVWGYDTVNISNNYCVNATNNTSNDGIYVSDIENFSISENFAKGSDCGIYAVDLNFGIPTTTRSKIVNNMIIGGDDGLYLDDIEEIDVFHNSTFAEDYGIYINDDVNLDIRNNIFSSNSDYAIDIVDQPTTLMLDYNLYNTLGSSVARVSGTLYADLPAFITGLPTLNIKSIEGDPNYNSPTSDLHVSGVLANNVGDSTVRVLFDYDGDSRPMAPSTIVDIGADEYIPPPCNVPNSLATTNITDSSATLSWVEAGIATQWEVEYGLTGFTLGTGTNMLVIDTFVNLTGLSFETHYDWYVRSICSRGDTSARPTLTFYTGYCTPAPISVHSSGITGVAFDTVNNTSGAEQGNYGNYSSYIGNLQNNAVANVDITFATGFTNETKIWIDWNKDLDFNDAGEEVYSGTSLSANPTTLNASFFIPASTPIDQYRMRIGGVDNSNITPCYTSIWGAFEDYTINVTAGPNCNEPNFFNLLGLGIDTALVSWTELGGATEWEVEYGVVGFTIGTGTSIITTIDTFITISGLLGATNYDVYVRAICSSTDSSTWGGPLSFTVLPYYPIGTINTVDASGVADSTGVSLQTSGIVMGTDLDGNGGYLFTVIDLSSGSQEGIGVFNSTDLNGYVVTQGDSVSISGTVGQFNGLTQLGSITDISIIATGVTEPTPIVVNFPSEGSESKWIQINNITALDPSSSANNNYNQRFTRGSDTLTVRVDRDTDVDDSLGVYPISIGDSLCSLIGIGGQFDNSNPFNRGYQIVPARFADLDTIGCAFIVGLKKEVSEKATFKIYPNPTNSQFEIRTSGFNNSIVNITIRDINGRIISNENISNATNPFNKPFDLSGRSKGIYFIIIQDGNKIVNRKLILQ